MHHDENTADPFNWTYFFAALVTLLALPLMHVILGWMVFFF